MGTATLEVSGTDAARWTADLHADTRLDLSNVTRGQLEIVFQQVESQQR